MKKFVLLSSALLSIFTAHLEAQVILQDSFTYANGAITNVSAFVWKTTPTATVPNAFVNNGRLEIFGTRAEDINSIFTGVPGSVVYASFIVNATNLVTTSTNYFAHFKDNASNFRARVFAVAGGAVGAANAWRLGIANALGANAPLVKIFPLDLATNVDYRVTVAYDNGGLSSTLWVDPVVSTDANILSTDTTTAITLTSYGFRQASVNPALLIDDLYVGNAFTDVSVGTPKPATVYYQPVAGPTAIFTGNSLNLSCVGGGAGTVTFQWQHAGTNLVDDANNTGTTSNILSIVSAQTYQAGAYRCIVASTTNSVLFNTATSIVAQVTVSAAPVPPTFITQPVSQSLYTGQNVTFSTTVSSPGNVSYQWKSNNVDIAGETGPTLTLNNVTPAYSGSLFRVGVTNDVVPNGILSTNATLTVSDPPTVSIAYLRNLVDATTFQFPANSTVPYRIVGTVTTFTNITTGNTASYYLQDGTGGINIFATLGGTFRPQQGDVVTYVGVLSSFSSGLELFADTINRTYTSYSVTGTAALPAPRKIPFSVTNTYGYAYCATNLGGSLVTLTNVYFGANAGAAIAGGQITVTNAAGETFPLNFFAVDLDTTGQILPEFATSVTGVFYGNHPNYSVGVTKFSDIVVAPPTLGVSQAGNVLTFSWTGAGYILQSQTNSASVGLDASNTGWFDYPGGNVSGVTATVDPLNPTVFFRLYKP